jgi:tocopherol O-methyltransferase
MKALKETTREIYDLASPELLEVFGPHLHDGYYETGQEPRIEAQERLVATLAARAHIARGMRVLDVGCGVGGPALWLARTHACRVTGITNSEVQARLGSSLARGSGLGDHVRFVVMDAERLALGRRSFDAVLVIGTLGHLEEQRLFLGECRRLVARGGRLAIADWMLAPGIRRGALAPLLERMGVPELHAPVTHALWLERLGWAEVAFSDETAHISPSWGIAFEDLARRAVWRLVRKLGPRALPLLATARAMKRAIHSRELVYAFITARA